MWSWSGVYLLLNVRPREEGRMDTINEVRALVSWRPLNDGASRQQ